MYLVNSLIVKFDVTYVMIIIYVRKGITLIKDRLGFNQF